MASKWESITSQQKIRTKRLNKEDKDYGTPIAGSKTEARGKLAHERVSREIWELCCVIEENGSSSEDKKIVNSRKNTAAKTSNKLCKQNINKCCTEEENTNSIDTILKDKEAEEKEDPIVTTIEFGKLFGIYTYISNKLVGILLRARKYGLVDFEGETLFQRRDDGVIISLLYPSAKVKKMLQEKTFTWGKCM